MFKLKNLSLCVLIAATALIVTSCCGGNDSAIQKTIPKDAVLVANINGAKIMEAFEMSEKNGKVSFPGWLEDAMGSDEEEVTEMLGKIAKAVEYESVYLVFPNEKSFFVTFMLKDKDEFVKILSDKDFEREDVSKPFTEGYSKGYTTVLINGNQAWLVDEKLSKAENKINNALENAKENGSLADLGSIGDFLGESNAMGKVMISKQGIMSVSEVKREMPESMKKAMNNFGEYICYSLEVKDNAIVLNGTAYDTEGKPFTAPGMKEIDTNFLRYMPEDPCFVFAMGISKDYPWNDFLNPLAKMGDYEVTAAVETVKPYLKSLDGTVAFGVGSFNVNDAEAFQYGQLDAIPATFLAKISPQKSNDLCGLMTNFLRQNDMSYQTLSDGTYSLTTGDFKFAFGNVGGYFAAANHSLRPTSANSKLEKVFKGKTMAGKLHINTLSDFDIPVKWGVDIELECQGANTTATLKLVGVKDPIVSTICKTFIQLEQRNRW